MNIVALAVCSLRPGAEFAMIEDDVTTIQWHTPNVEPLTTAEVEAEMLRLEQAAVDADAERLAVRESAMAKLAALGLSVDEVAAIVGSV